jgi:general stress protein 26
MLETIDKRKKVHELALHFDNAMLTTIGPSGSPKARPMHVARIDEDFCCLWFLTGKGNELVSEINQQETVLLIFQDANSAFLSLRGNARLVEDRAKVHELWKEPYKVGFRAEPTTPTSLSSLLNPLKPNIGTTEAPISLSIFMKLQKLTSTGIGCRLATRTCTRKRIYSAWID